jgi:hypothetical protein
MLSYSMYAPPSLAASFNAPPATYHLSPITQDPPAPSTADYQLVYAAPKSSKQNAVAKYEGCKPFRISVYEKHRGAYPTPLCPRKQIPKPVNTHADNTTSDLAGERVPLAPIYSNDESARVSPDLWISRLPDFSTSLLADLPTPPPCRCTCGTPVLRSH